MYGEETTKKTLLLLPGIQNALTKVIVEDRSLIHADCFWSRDAITIAESALDSMNQRMVLEHLRNVALATISMPALDRCAFSSALRGFGISPDAETLFDDFARHSREV
jgi:hypothetical protein